MNEANRSPLLAVGIDAADVNLIRRFIDEGKMPFLRSLLGGGRLIRIESTADIGSSSVWPTFTTGENPEAHGIFSEWCWEADTMRLSSLTGRHLHPFWKAFSDAGRTVGVIGVPFMPLVGLSHGFEIGELPPYLPANENAKLISKRRAHEALSHGQIKVSAPTDLKSLRRLASDSLAGIRVRGQLAQELLAKVRPDISIVVFTETHELSHCLWATVQPDQPIFKQEDMSQLTTVKPDLGEIFAEVDRQIGQLVKIVGDSARVLVFSVHGMTAGRGAPTFLAPLMCEAGFSQVAQHAPRSLRDRALHSIRALKNRTPYGVKKLYYRVAPRSVVRQFAAPTLLPDYDWSRTRAFPLVVEHHGSIRVNLEGREVKGIVSPDDYEKTCNELERWLYGLRTNGHPLVKKVMLTAINGAAAINRRLPDLIAHWEDAAFASPIKIDGSQSEFVRDSERHLSKHTAQGFCILKSDQTLAINDPLPLRDLSQLIKTIAAG